MFTTFESAALDIPPVFDNQDERWWAFVHVPLFSSYFHVVIDFEGPEGDTISKTILYQHVEQLVATAREERVQITEVQVVLPFHQSTTPCWTMAPLSAVLVGQEPGLDFEQRAVVYVLEDGRHVVESALSTLEGEIVNLQTLIKFPRQP